MSRCLHDHVYISNECSCTINDAFFTFSINENTLKRLIKVTALRDRFPAMLPTQRNLETSDLDGREGTARDIPDTITRKGDRGNMDS